MIPKHKPIRSTKIRQAAYMEDCTICLPGICNADPETTVLAHFSFEGGKMGGKPSDLGGGAFACSACHDSMDFRTDKPEAWDYYAARGIQRTLQRLYERGIVKVS